MSVRTELDSRLQTWADAQSPKIKIAFEGTPFTKPSDGSIYLQTFLAPTYTKSVTVDGTRSRDYGVYQINIWMQDGKGRGKMENVAFAIRDLFAVIPKVGTVSIEKTPHITSVIVDDGWAILPVIIYYRQEF